MERCAIDLGILLHKVVLFDNSPARIRNVLHRLWVLFCDVFPPKQSTILTNSVDLRAQVRYIYIYINEETDQVIAPTASWVSEKYAPFTPWRCPAKVVGSNPSSGSKLHIRAVKSFEAVSKKRESLDHSRCSMESKCPAKSRCKTNGANSSSPLLSDPGVDGVCQNCNRLPTPTAKNRPDGENLSVDTRPLKEK